MRNLLSEKRDSYASGTAARMKSRLLVSDVAAMPARDRFPVLGSPATTRYSTATKYTTAP